VKAVSFLRIVKSADLHDARKMLALPGLARARRVTTNANAASNQSVETQLTLERRSHTMRAGVMFR
jgi:hypothetical protein